MNFHLTKVSFKPAAAHNAAAEEKTGRRWMMYDFENDRFSDEDERRTYKIIRWWLLDCYYTYCRSHLHARKLGKGGGWAPDEHEIGYAYEQCEDSFRLPIEQVMFEVLALVLSGGRGSEEYPRAKIATILAKHDLGEMLATLQGEELREFTHDLKLLGLM
ncbi:hypothetical protein LZ017_15215 [Pelomonas sp. CA6]|uniref:hypothetical protein n=1 Tax=Pelomonas sp. CA6 TaxID=2907999 RepID=UPI001F4C376C|nr:hypothetical protein [Pelomonas sp. CA6]MCH7344729.1 hypothetical protein [Pelomonas sp. CA6]